MTIQTRSKLTAQLADIEDLLVRFKDKCASDVRATGLAATGDKGAQEGLARGRKAEDRLRSSIESSCLDVLLLQQPLIGDDMRFVTGAFRIVSDLSHIDGMTRDASFLVTEVPE
ncbi:MAG: phosphate transport system regulatory protein PhoU, partial [Coriobacteriaceae bacterium]|nr:phosphate transport system regulatory protein PhoU [Coriobacteriaceae bacterium]